MPDGTLVIPGGPSFSGTPTPPGVPPDAGIVNSFNTRTGDVVLTSGDVTAAGGALLAGPQTHTGSHTFGSGTGTATIVLNGNPIDEGIYWQNAGINRWRLQTNGANTLGLYAYGVSGSFTGTVMTVDATGTVSFGFPVKVGVTRTVAPNETVGLECTAYNTGSNTTNGHRINYFSSAGATGGFDIGFSVVSIFDPTTWNVSPAPSYDSVWIVSVSPNDSAHSWASNGMELDISNRGPDMGWKRDRTSLRPTGGILVAAENNTFGGTGGGEGKNVTFGVTIAHSGAVNSTGFLVKFYNGLLIEPNAIVGLTGRAIYATGDITGVASQIPYSPFQTDGTWLHGIDHTLATYQDGRAQTMSIGQSIGWIVGTNSAPTAVATITGSGGGTSASLTLTPAGTGSVVVAGPLAATGATIGTAGSAGAIAIDGPVGSNRYVSWYSASSNRWKMSPSVTPEGGSNAGSDFQIHRFADNGSFLAVALDINRANGSVSATGGINGTSIGATTASTGKFTTVGFNNTTPIAKPTVSGAKGSNVALASLLAALAAYGLITDTTTA